MKIPPRDIESFLKAPEARFQSALFYGPDAGLALERARRVKTMILAESADPFAFVELTDAALLHDPARLWDEIQSIGLLSSKRFILIRDAGDKSAVIISEAAAALHDGVFLVVIAGELSTRSALRDWFEKASNAAAIGCYRDEARDIHALVKQSFSAAGIEAGREVVDYLSTQLGNDREVTRQEIEKIIIYAGEEKTVSAEDVQTLVDYNRDTQMDDIVNAVADKNTAKLDRLLAQHLLEGTAPIVYLRALQRYFNRLYYIKARAEAGHDIETTVKNLKPKIFFRQEPLLIRHARNWTLPQITRALNYLISAELACKTSDIPAIAASSRRLFQVAQVR
jgi:DNA polymerase-3 subunit delta